VYRTVDPQGRPTTASGLLVLPRSQVRRLRTVSFAHGSEVTKTDAPSVSQDGWAYAPAVTYASAGFDGYHAGPDIFANLPTDPNDPSPIGRMLTPHAIDLLLHPTGPLATALAIHDSICTNWTPRIPGLLVQWRRTGTQRQQLPLPGRVAVVSWATVGH
jgi:hypothetical protein